MKLVVYKPHDSIVSERVGAIHNDQVVDLNEAYRHLLIKTGEIDLANNVNQLLPPSINDFFRLGSFAIERANEALQFAIDFRPDGVWFKRKNVLLGPPVPKGAKIICIGTNYKGHVKEMSADIPEYPVLFNKFDNALIGEDDEIQKSPYTEKLDYEGELTVVIGKKASHVKKESALDYIAGYTISNDISARDLQKRTPQWLQGKSLDKSTPVGPWIVTTDELRDPSNLTIETYVNGEKRQSSNTKYLIFNVPYLIEFISSLITLEPGDIILTGTPDGVGFASNPPLFLQDGDIVRIEIEKIGTLENKVKQQTLPNR